MIEPTRISSYDLVGVLGRGGMGVVYEAKHVDTGAPAAVKTVRVPSESTIESIRREIHMLRELRHPGVVAIRDHGVDAGMPWYAMDLLQGRTLRDDLRAWFPEPTFSGSDTRDLLKPGRIKADEPVQSKFVSPPYSLAHVTAVFRHLCEPLAYVHGQGVIHRDLSPANIFLVESDRPVLFDFGLAARRSRSGSDARDALEVGGTTRGTAHYMAPEQARGEVVDARADVYALGCILYEALTGRPPFLGDSSLAVLMQHIEDPPKPPSAHAPGVPSELDDLVMRMLAKSARERIGYVEDVAKVLESIGAPTASTTRGRAYTYRAGLAGRTDLLSVIEQALVQLVSGRGGCAVLLGESGVGKTRLAAELATRATEQGIRVVVGECEEHAAALHPLRPLLRMAVDAARDGGPGEAERLLGRDGGVLAAYEPAIAGLAPPRADEPVGRFLVLAALRDLVAALTADGPILFVVDDVQWADELALDDDASDLTEFVATRSAGNPLFAAEYVRIAVDEGVLQRDVSGRWRLSDRSGSYDRLPTPGSVAALVKQRLGGLPEAAHELALSAAVMGRPCDIKTLARAAGLGDTEALPAITELMRRHVLEEGANGDLRLVHDSLREQAYGDLAGDDRARRHRRAATAIEGGLGRDFALHYAELAFHHEQAGNLKHAGDYLELAADHALRTAAYGDARALLERLIAIALEVPDARRARWERWLGEACYALGDLAGCRSHLNASLDRLGRTIPASKLGWASAIARGVGGQITSRVRRKRPQDRDLAEAALASGRLTSCYLFDNDSLGLVGSALTAVNLAERAGDGVAVAEIYAQLGYVAGLAKLPKVARGYFERARKTAKATRDPVGMGKALFSEAAWHVGTGAWADAKATADEGLQIARALRDPQEAEVALTILGHVAFATGRYEESRRLAVELYDSARARNNAQHEAWGVYTVARAALYTGAVDEAIRELDRAMAMLAGLTDHASKILCGGLQAMALARAGETRRAREAADATTERIGDTTPPVFTIAEGYIGAAEAYLELWRATRDEALAGPAKVAIANLGRFARVFPIAQPAAASLSGLYELRRGNPRRAKKALTQGLALAEKLAMPYDIGVAKRGLGDVTSAR